MAPHKPRKSTPEQDSEDEDMIEYNPDEFDPDDYVQKYYNIGEYKSVITPTCYKNVRNQNWLLRQKPQTHSLTERMADVQDLKSALLYALKFESTTQASCINFHPNLRTDELE
ncbi:hypothetical protein TNCV_2370861 [Trichonephila clavipes]|nr:hypothetical protein TNCV_2370861 [Trichonephila clavipes]